jgi:RimJ/RimL family protein N-acetyltransferase
MRDLKNYKVAAPAPVTLKGRFVTLEPYDRQTHLSGLWQALGGAEGINDLLRYFPNEDYASADDLDRWLQSARQTGGYVTLVARENATGEIVGMASYMRPDPKNGVVEVGSVAHGLAMKRSPMSTELHYLMAKHVFDDLDYRRYEWKCHNENEASKLTARRYGFTFEGVFRQHVISRGANRDTAWFSMIDTEWPVVKAAFEAWLAPENFDADGRQKRKLEDIRTGIAEGAAA